MRAIVGALLLTLSAGAFGQASEIARPDAATEQRLKVLAEELRCLVCQNQTIADSNAPLAVDLRNQIRDQIGQGRSDDQIRDYMVERYGDFVLYRPPFKASTAILWVGPFVLVAGAIGILVFMVRRRRTAVPAEALTPDRRAEIEDLLEGDRPMAKGPAETKKRGRKGRA